MEDEDFF